MGDALYLEMPQQPKKRNSRFFRLFHAPRPWLFLAVLALALGVALLAWWFYLGRVASVAARIDGLVYTVSPRFSAVLASLDVRDGDAVTAGQVVGRMETGELARQMQQAGADVAALGAAGPDIRESAARLRQAQEAERDITARLAQARNEEDMLRRLREDRVTEHVRAQLALRGLDSQGAATREAREAALAAESTARIRKDQAVADFERASRMRAALDQELGRIRDESLRMRHASSRQRAAQPGNALPVDGNLYASASGTILRRTAEPGQLIQEGQPVAVILPSTATPGKDIFWVQAWFPATCAGRIYPGQGSSVTVEATGARLDGTVREVLPPQALPQALAMEGRQNDGEAYLPVRIALSGALPPALSPGAPARCVIQTRAIPGLGG